MCAHPLVSPLAARKEMWNGLRSGLEVGVFVQVGWEVCADEGEVLARRIRGGEEEEGEGEREGLGDGERTKVVFEGWEGMPHSFSALPFNRSAWTANGSWARFVRAVDAGEQGKKGKVENGARWVCGRTGKVRRVELEELGLTQVGCGYPRKEELTDEVVERKIEEGKRWREELERKMVEDWQAQQESEKA